MSLSVFLRRVDSLIEYYDSMRSSDIHAMYFAMGHMFTNICNDLYKETGMKFFDMA